MAIVKTDVPMTYELCTEIIHALAKAFRCSDLQLKVYPQNDDAVGFYRKTGFAVTPCTVIYDGQPVTRYRCERVK